MNKKQLLEVLKNRTYCQIKKSKIHGVGVFAVKRIPKGVNPFYGLESDKWLGFTKQELSKLDPKVKKLIEDFFTVQNKTVWIPAFGVTGMNMSFFMNTSQNPNITAIKNGESFKTKRVIKPDEELTVDYHTFSEEED